MLRRPLALLAGVCMLAACGVTAERTQLTTCGGCTFWKDANSSHLPTLSRTGTCVTSCSGGLDLSYKGIAVVANGTFDDLLSVQYLYLHGNTIQVLAPNSFAGLGSVQYLTLSDNQITALAPNAFAGLGSVHLNLDDNQITALAPNAFAGLGSVTGLSLSSNWITGLTNSTFAGLGSVRYLNLRNNKITTLTPNTFAGLGSVRSLYIDDNQITALAPNTFAGLGIMMYLSLRNNKITTLTPNTFAGLGSVTYLTLSGNQIEALAPNAFAGLGGVQRLDLHDNQITSLNNSTFARLPNLQELYLVNNPGVPFACPTVSGYSSGCEVNRVQICGGCTFWTHHIASSIGYLLSKTGSCETSCTYLDLNNKGIAVLTNNSFAGLGSVQYIILSGNQISTLEKNIFTGLDNVRYLNLQANQITSLTNSTFVDLPNLQSLYLDNNPGAPFACPVVSDHSSGCKRNVLATCGGCTFWVDGFSLVLSKTGNCETSCTSLWLMGMAITAVANGTFDDIGSLQDLSLWGSTLGCVPGVAVSVSINRYWTTPTPRCPSNCTVNTYYMPSEEICMDCPDNSYTLGIGSNGIGNCTSPLTANSNALSPILTATPSPNVCLDDDLPLPSTSGGTMCIPRHIYPSPKVKTCVFGKTWKDVMGDRDLLATGGLGKKQRAEWKVWVCDAAHPCVERKGDWLCFTYSERHEVFVPWDFNSALRIVRNATSPRERV